MSSYTNVVVHLWLKTSGTFESGDYARAYVRVDGDDKPYFFNETESALNSHDYQEHTYEVPAGANSIVIVYQVRDSADDERIYIDDVMIMGDPGATPTPTPWLFPRKVNYQPGSSEGQEGHAIDDGSPYGTYGDYGW